MNETLQTFIVAAAIIGAVTYLARRGRKKKCGSADGGCGCSTKGKPPGNPTPDGLPESRK